MNHPVLEPVTNVTAAAAVTSSIWMPSLHDASTFAAQWAPVLGAIWLILQIARFLVQTGWKLHAWWRGPKNKVK
jgi:hypothetical protein